MSFAYLDEADKHTSGLTNTWLESRSRENLFTGHYKDIGFGGIGESSGGGGSGSGSGNKMAEESTFYRTAIKQIQQSTPISDVFFSQGNIDHLKVLLCKQVALKYQQHNGGKTLSLSPQSQSSNILVTVMRSIFLQKCNNPAGQFCNEQKVKRAAINGEIIRLNRLILDDVVPRFYANVMMELTYRRDISNGIPTIQNPQNMSTAGTRSQELFSQNLFM